MLREQRDHFFGAIESDVNTNPKRFWSILKHNSKSRNIPNLVSMATTTNTTAGPDSQARTRTSAEDPQGIANLFNIYFVSVFSPGDSHEAPTPPPDEPCMTELSLTVPEVQSILERLDVTKATGPDGISARLLKETASVIAPSLCKLYNKSLSLGVLPQEWKEANVVPVFKKDKAEFTENYRPISLLSLISKVLERCVLNSFCDRLIEFAKACQHGFLQGKSCTSNLLEVLDFVGALLDKGGQVDMVYMDMSKAFDKVSHPRLLQKLRSFGFGGSLLQWFDSYMTGRQQRVTVLGATSEPLPICSGVPQGSILGPALFLIYVNDLPDVVERSHIAMFADDAKIYHQIKAPDDAACLQSDLDRMDGWATDAGLLFNESKCKAQRVTRKKKPVVTDYTIKSKVVETVETERDLGVLVTDNLTWNNHVRYQTSRANKLLGYIRRNTNFIKTLKVRRLMYLTLVRPLLGYATQVWAPQAIGLIQSIERVQRRATKYILKLPFITEISYSSRLKILNLLPLTYWHEYLDLMFFFKMTNGHVNVNPLSLPTERSARQTRSTSTTSIKYNEYKCKTSTYQKSYFVRTTRIWNCLSSELNLNCQSVNSFKSVLLEYYFAALNFYDAEDPRCYKTVCLKCNSCRSLARNVICCN